MTVFKKNTQISSFMKICPVGAELFHADGQMDMAKLIVAFHNFANAPKTGVQVSVHIFSKHRLITDSNKSVKT